MSECPRCKEFNTIPFGGAEERAAWDALGRSFAIHTCGVTVASESLGQPTDNDATRLALVVTHTRANTPCGPDYCAECSEAITDWVPWPCPRAMKDDQ